MTDGVAEDAVRLRDVLKSLGGAPEETTDKGCKIADEGGAVGLASLLREIEETVLPRQLTFTGGADAQVTAVVVERRILRMGTQGGEMKSAETGEQIAAMLETFCAAASAVHVRRDLLEAAPTSAVAGVSLSDLSPFLSGTADRSGPLIPVEIALAESERYVLALCDARGEGGPRLKGKDAIGARLQRLEDNLSGGAGDPDNPAPAHRIWIGGPSDPFAILLVTLPQGRIWLAFEPEHLDTCIACWSGVD